MSTTINNLTQEQVSLLKECFQDRVITKEEKRKLNDAQISDEFLKDIIQDDVMLNKLLKEPQMPKEPSWGDKFKQGCSQALAFLYYLPDMILRPTVYFGNEQ